MTFADCSIAFSIAGSTMFWTCSSSWPWGPWSPAYSIPVAESRPPAERVAVQVADGAGSAQRIGAEALDVGHLDREVEHQRAGAVAVGIGAAVVVGLAERDVAEHLLGEADGRGHAAAASATARSGSSMWSAKRSASAAIVKLGFGPTGPGMTEPSAIVKPG